MNGFNRQKFNTKRNFKRVPNYVGQVCVRLIFVTYEFK